MSIRSRGLPTCSPGSPITRLPTWPRCYPGIGAAPSRSSAPPDCGSTSSRDHDQPRRRNSWRGRGAVVGVGYGVPDELLDALFELSWQVVVVQQDPVFHRAMISLDLALRHRVVRPAADMSDAVVLEPLAKLVRHVGWTVIAQQPWPMQNLDLVQT